jgi:hypothetical protein
MAFRLSNRLVFGDRQAFGSPARLSVALGLLALACSLAAAPANAQRRPGGSTPPPPPSTTGPIITQPTPPPNVSAPQSGQLTGFSTQSLNGGTQFLPPPQ